MIRERIIRLHYDEDALKFITDDAVHAFQNTLGRMLAYGLRSGENNGVEFIELYINGAGEIAGAFFPPVERREAGTKEDFAPFIALSDAIDEFKQGEPTTMAALPSAVGTYDFH